MKRSFLLAAVFSFSGALLVANMPFALAQAPGTNPAQSTNVSDAKKKSIQELITVSGAAKAMRVSLEQELEAAQAADPNMPKEFVTKVKAKLEEKMPALMESLIPVYDKNFTQAEIDSLITFYKTPTGQKLADKAPTLTKDGNAARDQWARAIAEETVKSMQTDAGSKPAQSGANGFDKAPFKGNGKPVTTPSGLKYEDMTIGKGAVATPGKTAVVHYTGTLTDGSKFDSSRDRGNPFPFTVGAGEVIKGWDEGVAGMKVGGRRKLTIPYQLAYGESGRPPVIPPKATLVFDVELIDVK